MKLYTIGYAQKSAQQFFTLLKDNNVECLVYMRLYPKGQLDAFAKQRDLKFFLSQLNDCDYQYLKILAPTKEVLKSYRKNLNWDLYVQRFESLMDERNIPESLDRSLFYQKVSCLLCYEPTPERCHRRLVAERLARAWGDE